MSAGLSLVKAHLDSFLSGRIEDFERQLTPNFRHCHLPADLGEGPEHARRWRELQFKIYRQWRAEIVDAHDDGENVIVRINFAGADPTDPSMPPTCESSAVMHYEIAEGRLAACGAVHQTFEEFREAFHELAPRRLH